jgi:hypothetical protein
MRFRMLHLRRTEGVTDRWNPGLNIGGTPNRVRFDRRKADRRDARAQAEPAVYPRALGTARAPAWFPTHPLS